MASMLRVLPWCSTSSDVTHSERNAISRAFAQVASRGCDALVLQPLCCGLNGCWHPGLDFADIIHTVAAQHANYIPLVCVASDYPRHFQDGWWDAFVVALQHGRPLAVDRPLAVGTEDQKQWPATASTSVGSSSGRATPLQRRLVATSPLPSVLPRPMSQKDPVRDKRQERCSSAFRNTQTTKSLYPNHRWASPRTWSTPRSSHGRHWTDLAR